MPEDCHSTRRSSRFFRKTAMRAMGLIQAHARQDCVWIVREFAFAAHEKFGPAIIRGNPDKSPWCGELSRATRKRECRRPRRATLSSREQIALLRRWVKEGAVYEEHWSFIPPKRPAIPETKDQHGRETPIDRFILSRLEKEGLRPLRRGRQADAHSTRDLRSDRLAADSGRGCGVCGGRVRRTPMRKSWTGCWPVRDTASIAPTTGSMWRATAILTACIWIISAASGRTAIT